MGLASLPPAALLRVLAFTGSDGLRTMRSLSVETRRRVREDSRIASQVLVSCDADQLYRLAVTSDAKPLLLRNVGDRIGLHRGRLKLTTQLIRTRWSQLGEIDLSPGSDQIDALARSLCFRPSWGVQNPLIPLTNVTNFPMLVHCPSTRVLCALLQSAASLKELDWVDSSFPPSVVASRLFWPRLCSIPVSRRTFPSNAPTHRRPRSSQTLPPPKLYLLARLPPTPHRPPRRIAFPSVTHPRSFSPLARELLARLQTRTERRSVQRDTDLDTKLMISDHLRALMEEQLHIVAHAAVALLARCAHSLDTLRLVGRFFDSDLAVKSLRFLPCMVTERPAEAPVASFEDLEEIKMSRSDPRIPPECPGRLIMSRLRNLDVPGQIGQQLYCPQLRHARLIRLDGHVDLVSFLKRHSETLTSVTLNVESAIRDEAVNLPQLRSLHVSIGSSFGTVLCALSQIHTPNLKCLKIVRHGQGLPMPARGKDLARGGQVFEASIRAMEHTLDHLALEVHDTSLPHMALTLPTLRYLAAPVNFVLDLLACRGAVPQLSALAIRRGLGARGDELAGLMSRLFGILGALVEGANSRPSLKALCLPALTTRVSSLNQRLSRSLSWGGFLYITALCVGGTGFDMMHALPPCTFEAVKVLVFTPVVALTEMAHQISRRCPHVECTIFLGGVAMPNHRERIDKVARGLSYCRRLQKIIWPRDFEESPKLIKMLNTCGYTPVDLECHEASNHEGYLYTEEIEKLQDPQCCGLVDTLDVKILDIKTLSTLLGVDPSVVHKSKLKSWIRI